MRFSLILVVIQICWCLPVEKSSNPPPKTALDFMKQYGYLKADKTTSAALYTEEGLSEVIKTVQRFGALEETGKLDNATLKLMTKPRCGNADVIQAKRSKRFVLTSGWDKRHITYYVANWSSKLGEQVVARLIGKALNTWGSYANLKFSRSGTPDADIIVSFARGAHNDPFPFDGPGYVLAHAYFPNSGSSISGDIHFDDDENWVYENPQAIEDGGTDFYSVALHELGHSLGLAHSSDPRSVMFPYYQGGDESSLQLGQDDILAMYQLYIARSIKEETTTTTTEPTRRTRPLRTRPPNEPPRTRPTKPPKKTTYQGSSTRLYSEHRPSRVWETSTTSIRTYAPTHKTTHTNDPKIHQSTSRTTNTYITKTYPSTYYPSNRDRTPSVRNRETGGTSYTTSIHATRRNGNTYSGRETATSTYWKDHNNNIQTSTMKSNNRFPSTTSTEITIRRDTDRPRTSSVTGTKPYYPPSRYPTDLHSTTVPPEPNICEGRFDSVANLRGEIFIFKNEYIWRLHDFNRIVPGYPVLLRQMFPHLPDDIKKIDAAYQRPDGNMVLFSGDLYWIYDGTNFVENSPKYIMDYGIPLGIGGIDAVQTWGRNGKTYLYKDDRFWRYNETSRSPELGYPQLITKWRGLPSNIDAAMTWKDGKTYFFKDNLFWILDNHRVEITRDSPRYSTREILRCP